MSICQCNSIFPRILNDHREVKSSVSNTMTAAAVQLQTDGLFKLHRFDVENNGVTSLFSQFSRKI